MIMEPDFWANRGLEIQGGTIVYGYHDEVSFYVNNLTRHNRSIEFGDCIGYLIQVAVINPMVSFLFLSYMHKIIHINKTYP